MTEVQPSHANPYEVEELIGNLEGVLKETYPRKLDMTLQSVTKRLKENLQYNNSPTTS